MYRMNFVNNVRRNSGDIFCSLLPEGARFVAVKSICDVNSRTRMMELAPIFETELLYVTLASQSATNAHSSPPTVIVISWTNFALHLIVLFSLLSNLITNDWKLFDR